MQNIQLITERLSILQVSIADADELLNYSVQNRSHLEQWEPLRDDAYYTFEKSRDRLIEIESNMEAGRAMNFLLRRKDSSTIIGVCNFNNIIRGAFQACHLGYSLDAAAQGQGLMEEALRTSIDFMFQQMHLHRIMANYRPENERSGKLLARLGFEIEGKAREYLQINGQWCDHILTALINPQL